MHSYGARTQKLIQDAGELIVPVQTIHLSGSVRRKKPEDRTCYNCQQKGHLAYACKNLTVKKPRAP